VGGGFSDGPNVSKLIPYQLAKTGIDLFNVLYLILSNTEEY